MDLGKRVRRRPEGHGIDQQAGDQKHDQEEERSDQRGSELLQHHRRVRRGRGADGRGLHHLERQGQGHIEHLRKGHDTHEEPEVLAVVTERPVE